MREYDQEIVPATVSNWENGVSTPEANKLPALAKILGVEIKEFYA